MNINPIQATTGQELVLRILEKVDAPKFKNPVLDMSPNQINRTYEMSKDPPVTVLKYVDTTTKEVELQIPSETSLRLYRSNEAFLARINSVNIIV